MNIHQRINEVRKRVAYLRKDKKVGEGGGYMAVTHDNVTGEVRDHFIEHGIVVEPPDLFKSAVVPTGTTTAKGVPFIRYEATYTIDFVNMDEPTDRISKKIEVHAIDQGDKAPGKAMSYAKKYAVIKILELESGEDEEARPEVKAAPKERISANAGAMDHVPADRQEFVRTTANSIVDCFIADNIARSYELYYENDDIKDNEEKLAIWSLLDSGLRRNLKQMYRDKLRGIAPKSNGESHATV